MWELLYSAYEVAIAVAGELTPRQWYIIGLSIVAVSRTYYIQYSLNQKIKYLKEHSSCENCGHETPEFKYHVPGSVDPDYERYLRAQIDQAIFEQRHEALFESLVRDKIIRIAKNGKEFERVPAVEEEELFVEKEPSTYKSVLDSKEVFVNEKLDDYNTFYERFMVLTDNYFDYNFFASDLSLWISDFYLGVSVELFLIFCLLITLIFFVIFDFLLKYKFIESMPISYVCLLIFFLVMLILNNTVGYYIFDFIMIEDKFSVTIQNILLINVIFFLIISSDYVYKEKIINYEYFLLIGLAVIGIITIVKSNDLISLYLGLELQSLSFYILASFKIYSNFSTEAGLKYFILGAFSSGLLLFGCSLVYGFVGTTNFNDLQLLFLKPIFSDHILIGFLVGIIFITVGILFKLGVVPFHMWLPDVYEGVPTSVTAFFAIIPKIALLGLLFRLGGNVCADNFFVWNQLFIYTSLLSIGIGTLGALYQVKIKKFIAYSTISHTGFLLIGYSSFSNFSLFAIYVYILVYVIISFNIFTLILSVRKQDNFLKIKKLNEFITLFKSNPILAVNFCLILFSIAGIPPLLGFYSKFYVFLSALKYELYFSVFVAALFSVLASMYYIRLIKLMFFKKVKFWIFLFEISKSNSLILSLTLFLNLIFCFFPERFLILIYTNLLSL